MVLCGSPRPAQVEVELPDGTRVAFDVAMAESNPDSASAGVRKFAGDDPDVTDGCLVIASVAWTDGPHLTLVAGEGVGVVTKPGLALPPGEPAINPVPRRMISQAVREVLDRPLQVTISIPGGKELAQKTFNPRLGVVGGLSVLGTTGIVRPFSAAAMRDAIECAMAVASACGISAPVFVPGRIGEKAASRRFRLAPEQLIEVSNEWGFALDCAMKFNFRRLLIVGHPGKLAKLPAGDWDTHSSRSDSAAPWVSDFAWRALGLKTPESKTVEGLLGLLPEGDRVVLVKELAALIRQAIETRLDGRAQAAVVLVNLQSEILGGDGDLAPWE
jgi:cobalt-precorrin-5B (C1)-methyltransferase